MIFILQKLIEIFKPNFDDSSGLERQFSDTETTESLPRSSSGSLKGKLPRSRSQESRQAELEVCIPPPSSGAPASL